MLLLHEYPFADWIATIGYLDRIRRRDAQHLLAFPDSLDILELTNFIVVTVLRVSHGNASQGSYVNLEIPDDEMEPALIYAVDFFDDDDLIISHEGAGGLKLSMLGIGTLSGLLDPVPDGWTVDALSSVGVSIHSRWIDQQLKKGFWNPLGLQANSRHEDEGSWSNLSAWSAAQSGDEWAGGKAGLLGDDEPRTGDPGV